MIKAGIIGGTGYVAGETLRCLLRHPDVEIDFIYSHSKPGEKASAYHDDLFAFPDLNFSSEVNPSVEVLFLCLGHEKSKGFLAQHAFSKTTKIVDLSRDFRLIADTKWQETDFVYGLPELNKEAIQKGTHIANPGCFATAIQLALLPLAKANLLHSDVHIHALTGSTGAGASLASTAHFSWRNNNVSIYKAFRHQHLGEIKQSLNQLQDTAIPSLDFLPMRGDFTRGIFASIYMKCAEEESSLQALYQAFYESAPFTSISESTIHLKQVVNTNHCLLQVQKIEGKILISSCIDNLLKGAAGQAIQNMNLMFGLEEARGLDYKASYF